MPSDFWDMTPMELNALCESAMRAHPKYVEPVSLDEFEALKARFPDKSE